MTLTAVLIRLRHNPTAMFGLGLLALILGVAAGCDKGDDKPVRPFGW